MLIAGEGGPADPQRALKLLLQSAGPELILSSQRVLVDKLEGDGFVFRDRTAEEAIDAAIPA